LVAMCDVDDLKTRLAAGGGLAMLTEFEPVVGGVLELKRGVEIVLGLCGEEDEGIVHRGLVIVRNLVCAEEETGKKGRERVMEEGGIDRIKAALKLTKRPDLLQVGVEALKVLVEEDKK